MRAVLKASVLALHATFCAAVHAKFAREISSPLRLKLWLCRLLNYWQQLDILSASNVIGVPPAEGLAA